MTMDRRLVQAKLENKYPESRVNVHTLDDVHFDVQIESPAFRGLTRIEQHQQVMQVFDQELKSGALHALSIKTKVL